MKKNFSSKTRQNDKGSFISTTGLFFPTPLFLLFCSTFAHSCCRVFVMSFCRIHDAGSMDGMDWMDWIPRPFCRVVALSYPRTLVHSSFTNTLSPSHTPPILSSMTHWPAPLRPHHPWLRPRLLRVPASGRRGMA